MKKALVVLVASALGLLVMPATAVAQDTPTIVELSATLSGANEVGDAGDTNGTGAATIKVDAAATQICYEISVAEIGPVTAGHIHNGGAGTNGDVVVDLKMDTALDASCVDSDTATIAAILNTPQLFYVNVHNEDFPGGAIRGQLAAPVAAAAETTEAAPDTTADTTAAATDTTAETTDALAFTDTATTTWLASAGLVLLTAGGVLVCGSRRRR